MFGAQYGTPQPIYNPPLPSEHMIPGGLTLGQVIVVQGSIPPYQPGGTYCINLKPNVGSDDIYFHMSVRFNENCVVRNSKQGGRWQSEERDGGMPFIQGQQFQVMISVQQDALKISVNGKHFTDFKYRAPFHQITAIALTGDFTIASVTFQNNAAYGFAATIPPIYNPPVPSDHMIPGGVTLDQAIVVQGYIPPNNPEGTYCVNLKPQMGSDDIYFHMSVRFNEGCVVRNSKQGGRWQSEERDGGVPFTPGQQFQLMISVQQDALKVAVNGRHFTSFKHRAPYQHINAIALTGDFTIQSVAFQSDPAVSAVSGYTTGPAMPPPAYSPYSGNPPIYNPPVPFAGPIAGGLYPGRMISVQGIARAPTRFDINLKLGGDIAFHFNPRFDENCVVRNTRTGGSWGSEERHGSLPFVPGGMFDIKILCEASCYKVAVNSQHFCEYYHRLHQLNMIQGLEVGGDVQLTQIFIQ